MSTIINGSTDAITFPDSTIQNTSAVVSGKVPYSVLPTGSVLQVVNATYGTLVGTTTSTWIDTGLTASITPKFSTSKVLVIVSQCGIAKDTSNTSVAVQVLRNSTSIIQFSDTTGYTADISPNRVGSVSTSYLDAPATTSAITYKTQFKSTQNLSNAYVNVDGSGSTSTITLMEIAG